MKSSQIIIKRSFEKVSVYKGFVQQNTKIISEGELVEGEKYLSLLSKNEYSSKLWGEFSYYWQS